MTSSTGETFRAAATGSGEGKEEGMAVMKRYVTAVVCAQGKLISTGKDDMLSIFSADQGEYQFLRQIALEQFHFASSIDFLDGKILIGHDNGKI